MIERGDEVKREIRLACGAALAGGLLLAAGMTGAAQTSPSRVADLRFEVRVGDGMLAAPVSGRLVVAVSRPGRREPRLRIGRVAPDATPIAGVDVRGVGVGDTVVVDGSAAAFPYATLADLPPGDYLAQAVLDVSRDHRSHGAPGNLYSQPRPFSVGGPPGRAVRLQLTQRVREEPEPVETEHVRFVRLRSARLSRFHGRPFDLRAGVILPRGYEDDPARRYPVRVRVGGYGDRYTEVMRLMGPGSAFREAWLADDMPRMILLHLDGAGPYGDPYQVNSANNGPYGDAITRELIPLIETRFRAVGDPDARVIDGGSTGGWVALALQVFYPDFFNGAWSSCPDGLDFRRLQLVNIYDDANAYVDELGRERPAARDTSGDVRFTMRQELGMESVLGRGDSWTRSGRQWGAWNAVYGPRGDDGLPVPLWDPVTGDIDHTVTVHWERYDLRLRLARDWTTLGPKLRGKINIWVGEADDYYLDGAVRLFDAWLDDTDPVYDARVVYGPGRGHCWVGLTPAEMMREMGARTGARP